MSFFVDWNSDKENCKSTEDYENKFIRSSLCSIESLLNGNEEELAAAYAVLQNTALSTFLMKVKSLNNLRGLQAADVPCFSSLENGASRLNELLLFSPDGLTFSEIGYQLMNSVSDVARKKYGENHSKLAATMSLVTLSTYRPIVVKPTAWGNFLTRYTFSEKKDVLRKLLLRDICVQHILSHAFLGPVRYRDVVSFLSDSTKTRRGTNVRALVNFILEDTEYEIVLSNIDWEV